MSELKVTPPIGHLSPSTCQSYRKCGYQVYLDKVMHVPNPMKYAMTAYGTAMHMAVERLVKEDLSLEAYLKAFSEYWEEVSKEVNVWKADTQTGLLVEGLKACKDLYPIVKSYAIIETEKEFKIEREGHLPILCYADAITADKKIIDYKFGRGLIGVADSRGYALNMSTYSMGYAMEHKDELPEKIVFIKQRWRYKINKVTKQREFYHSEFVIEEREVFKDDVRFYKDVYNGVETGIRAGVYLPAEDDSPFCKSCGYRIIGKCKKPIMEDVKK